MEGGWYFCLLTACLGGPSRDGGLLLCRNVCCSQCWVEVEIPDLRLGTSEGLAVDNRFLGVFGSMKVGG